MDTLAISSTNLIVLYFVYGLSFFVLGIITLALSTKIIRYPIERNFWWLGAFGLSHGIYEWLAMLLLLGKNIWPPFISFHLSNIELVTLAGSYLFFLGFGLKSLFVPSVKYQRIVNYFLFITFICVVALIIHCFLYHSSKSTHVVDIEIMLRYFLCFPAAVFTTIAMFRYFAITRCDAECPKEINISAIIMGFTFLFYGIVAGIVVPPSNFWPASMINTSSFQLIIGINVVIFRTLCAFILSLSIYQVLIACNSCMISQIKDQQELDPLTKLKNRRCMDEQLKTHCEYAKRYHRPLAILFIDIDHFKHYNDNYGHTEGDKVLQKIAQTFKSKVRNLDLIFRFGGEEFVLLLPETSIKVALKTALRLKKLIGKISFHPQSDTVHKTVSIGVAQYQANMQPDELINTADKAMYRAKQKGRNKICVHEQKKCYS